jgi:hypothetical protein
MRDWLGAGKRTRDWRPFEEAVKFIRSLGMSGQPQWRAYCKSDKMPDDIPSNPASVYRDEWKGWPYWFGNRYRGRNVEWRSFNKTVKWARGFGFKSHLDWVEYWRKSERPNDIPSNPNLAYKKEWRGWPHFLGFKSSPSHPAQCCKKPRSFNKMVKWARSLGLKSAMEWREHWKANERPSDIPATPNTAYKKQWRGWPHFLGFTPNPKQYGRWSGKVRPSWASL